MAKFFTPHLLVSSRRKHLSFIQQPQTASMCLRKSYMFVIVLSHRVRIMHTNIQVISYVVFAYSLLPKIQKGNRTR